MVLFLFSGLTTERSVWESCRILVWLIIHKNMVFNLIFEKFWYCLLFFLDKPSCSTAFNNLWFKAIFSRIFWYFFILMIPIVSMLLSDKRLSHIKFKFTSQRFSFSHIFACHFRFWMHNQSANQKPNGYALIKTKGNFNCYFWIFFFYASLINIIRQFSMFYECFDFTTVIISGLCY